MASSLFWFDNSIGLCALYFVTPQDFFFDDIVHNVYDVVVDDNWDEEKLLVILPQEIVLHIIESIKPPLTHGELNIPFSRLDSKVIFIEKSA